VKRVAVIDYGSGNLDSVARALAECGASAVVTSSRDEIERAEALVLPGVGAFAPGMEALRARRLDEVLERQVRERRVPLLGLCLGMQLLAASGDERGGGVGLGWIDGAVRRLEPNGSGERIPHVGWNELEVVRDSPLLDGIASGTDVYFVHSYHLACADPADVIATTPYCSGFASVVGHENVWGVQFHPEKSQKTGFALLRNFLAL
jgi:glutamine amidotransferase